ncbi:hypothetical protein LTS02_008918 [Friedmanniomyces endolithicus]|nr:hypothetical protein LTR75_012237 [Friedmanniomyces endolithicus]KAK0795864.1 hypothetical protein LTR38_008758 [Friedmanniomyces endolithicus]KAK0815849.1 hypothetical protein LTR59_000222 [Friedmanniomyces endolithicus]KAK0827262.1 hypothetical protein LTR03_016903 [Friedmanniomyces endolithicus]KAK0859853.1 hypothetical protein LTS02_008918 [Friedmanniomyces endolithicus]
MPSQHKNVVLLIADDLGMYISSYGCPSICTPNLDRLASAGTRFDMAFASTASCSGSRSTIYTGLHTHENGQYGLNWSKSHFQTFQHVDSAPKLFNQAGYRTGIVGKVHVGTEGVYPWQVREESGTRDVAWVADRCEAFFEQAMADDKPFFLTVGYVDPHRDIATRGGFGNHEEQHGSRVPLLDVKLEDVEVPRWLTDLPETRQELVEYYKAVNRIDTGVGLVYEALERQGLLESTLIVFTSDNGPPFVNSKTTLYDAGIHLPLIVRQPGAKAGTVNSNMISFVDILPTLLDWANVPLNTQISNRDNKLPASPPRHGRSFLPILKCTDLLSDSKWQHHVFGSHTFHEMQNYWPTRVLRTRRYKYHRNVAWRLDFPFAGDLYASASFEGIRNMEPPVMIGRRKLKDYIFRPSEELYDLEVDPDEIHNLAGDKEHEVLLLECRERVSEWQTQTKDLWLYRDGQSLTVLGRYAKDGLQVPERLDFDVERPGTRGVEMTRHLGVDGYSAGIER